MSDMTSTRRVLKDLSLSEGSGRVKPSWQRTFREHRLCSVFGDLFACSPGCYLQARGRKVQSYMAKSSFKLKILYGEGEAEVVTAQAGSMEKAGHQVTGAV